VKIIIYKTSNEKHFQIVEKIKIKFYSTTASKAINNLSKTNFSQIKV
jgi:hypothetical protein